MGISGAALDRDRWLWRTHTHTQTHTHAHHLHTPRLVPSPPPGLLLLKPVRCASGGVRDYLAAAGKTLACAFVLRSPRTHNGPDYVLSLLLCVSLALSLSLSFCLSSSLSFSIFL